MEREKNEVGSLLLEQRMALEQARRWGLTLEEPFAMSAVSFVAPTTQGDVLKVASLNDDESIHEADALALWDGEGAVRVRRRAGRVLLEERALPGTDLSLEDERKSLSVALEIATRLWRRARPPFRPVSPAVNEWLTDSQERGSRLAPLARRLFENMECSHDWVVHGDFHHYNIVQSSRGYVAIDPKPYLAEREYDVAAWLWNPMGNDLRDRAQTEERIAGFVSLGLDEKKIRAWTVIRGSYLRQDDQYVQRLESLLI